MVSPEAESHKWIEALVSVLGMAVAFFGRHLWGLSGKQRELDARMKVAEKRAANHDESIISLTRCSVKTESTLIDIGQDLTEMKTGINKLVNHVNGNELAG